jgi:hypothetical protein
MSNKDDTNVRLAKLEQENTELRERLARLENPAPRVEEPAPKVAPPPRDDGGARVITIIPLSANLPSEDESRALLKIVRVRFPQLKCQYSRWLTPDDELNGFRAAFAYICSLTITEKPTVKFAGSWWIEEAREYCRKASVQGRILSLTPAIIATASVPFSMDDFDAIWLNPYRGGKPVDDQAWRKLLAGGDLLAPTRIEKLTDHSIGYRRVITPSW